MLRASSIGNGFCALIRCSWPSHERRVMRHPRRPKPWGKGLSGPGTTEASPTESQRKKREAHR
eukprot:13672071-Alexandrium_andersonii.AAC.1